MSEINADAATPSSPADQMQRLIGELLLERGLVSEQELERALSLQRQVPGRLGALLIRIGAISEDRLLPVLAEQLEMPLLEARDLPETTVLILQAMEQTGIALDWWLDQEVVAWEGMDGEWVCMARDPLESSRNEILERALDGRSWHWALARSHHLEQILAILADPEQRDPGSAGGEAHLRELAEEAPVIEFVNNLIAQAFDQRASDIHIEPEERLFNIRFRIDGVLYKRFTLAMERYGAIASRIKLVSGMDIAERRLPQDGRLETRVSGNALDVRVSCLPGVHGESVVMRLLPKEKRALDLDSIGLARDSLQHLAGWVREPHGIVLVTGPTGSGKSTTLYSVLEAVNDGDKKIITVEDPVEYRLAGITQVQTMDDIGYGFARALRAILRQDPDVVMIGEIRDGETAEIAVQASLTGHLVFSTLHTNDAASAFTRLIDMGVEPFLVATPVRGVLAQRLVRRLCTHCAAPLDRVPQDIEKMPAIERDADSRRPAHWLSAQGCEQCQGTGYAGRTGIHELIQVTPEIQRLISQQGSAQAIREEAARLGYRSLREDGLLKARQGITSIDEVLRVVAS
jgi:general secretion pathway protein E